jgi:acetylxylan esterase
MRFTTGTVILTLTSTVCSQGLQEVANYGSTKSGAKMFVYKPTNLVQKPAILVGVHYCGGNAQKYYSGSPYKSLADQKGFLVVYPQASHNCWDVSSKASLVRDGGAESNSIAEMIKHATVQYNADASKVFVIGESSGGMMTVCLSPRGSYVKESWVTHS